VRPDIDGDQTIGKVLTPARRSGPLVILPALLAARTRAGLAGRSPRPPASTTPARPGRHPATSAGGPPGRRRRGHILDGLSYRRAGRAVGISKTEVGDSLDLLLGPLAAVGYCQPDGSFITSLDQLRELLAEMAQAGEAVCVDGLATRVQRPCGWANQKVLYDSQRHAHTAQGLAVSSIWGDLLWCDGGWPGSCHE
jgi:hypothetical protein